MTGNRLRLNSACFGGDARLFGLDVGVRITLLQRSVSSRLSFAISSGVPPAAIRLSSRKRVLVSVSLRISLTVRLSFAMIGRGVFGGALIAFQVSDRILCVPASSSVGISGMMSRRLSVATARMRALPASCSLCADGQFHEDQ